MIKTLIQHFPGYSSNARNFPGYSSNATSYENESHLLRITKDSHQDFQVFSFGKIVC